MKNPYNPPKSVVSDDSSASFKRSIWWKIYFYVITILSVIGAISFLFYEGSGFIEYIQLVLLALATAGLFGFVFGKKIFFPKFWLPFLILYLLFGIFYEQLTDINVRDGMTNLEYNISLGIGLVISLPGYIALFLYSKSNKYPWNVA